MTQYQVLQIARDAALEGREDARASIFAELSGEDLAAYVRRVPQDWAWWQTWPHVADDDAVEVRFRSYVQLVCTSPSYNGFVTWDDK